jgi:hypothetical protein
VVLHERDIVFTGNTFDLTVNATNGSSAQPTTTADLQPTIDSQQSFVVTLTPSGKGYTSFEARTTPPIKLDPGTNFTFSLEPSFLATNSVISVKVFPSLFKRLVDARNDRNVPIKTVQWPVAPKR